MRATLSERRGALRTLHVCAHHTFPQMRAGFFFIIILNYYSCYSYYFFPAHCQGRSFIRCTQYACRQPFITRFFFHVAMRARASASERARQEGWIVAGTNLPKANAADSSGAGCIVLLYSHCF